MQRAGDIVCLFLYFASHNRSSNEIHHKIPRVVFILKTDFTILLYLKLRRKRLDGRLFEVVVSVARKGRVATLQAQPSVVLSFASSPYYVVEDAVFLIVLRRARKG